MISSRELCFSYVAGSALRFPDVHVAQGHVAVLRGDSGSGKSTWLALACGLLTPQSGEMSVAGQNIAALQGAARDAWRGRHIGFLPQRLHLSAALSVKDNLGLAYYAAGLQEDKTQIASCLNALGVADLAQRMPNELSGGQAQRVALARAVLLQPRVILADEPTASLDDNAALQAIALLVQHAQRCGASLVIATHDARVGTALVTHVAAQSLQTIHMSQFDLRNSPKATQNVRKQL